MPSSPLAVTLAGGAIGFNWLPVIVAQKNGYFAEHGLEVKVIRTGSVDKATTAVRDGTALLAVTPPEGAIRDAVQGGSLRIVGGNVNRLPLSLVAAPRFKRIEDLRGARLGTSSLTEGTAIYTIEMLARHGLKYPGDFTFEVVGVHPARWKALQEGAIEAAVQLIPLNFVAFDQGYSNLGEVPDYIPEIAFSALIVDKDRASQNTEAVIGVLRSLQLAVNYIYDSPDQDALISLVMELTQADHRYGLRSLDYMRKQATFERDLDIPPRAFETSVELMTKAGLLTPELARSAGTAMLTDYRQQALRSFNPR